MEGGEEDVVAYNQRIINLWETTKVCNKFCKTIKFEQELSDDDKTCLSNFLLKKTPFF